MSDYNVGFLDNSDHPDLAPNRGPAVVNPKIALTQRELDATRADSPTQAKAKAAGAQSQADFSGYTAGAAPRGKPTPPASMLNNR